MPDWTGACLKVHAPTHHMDKQYAAAVILIIFGLGLTQIQGSDGSFLMGLGIGTIVISLVWIVRIIVRDLKRR